MKRSVFFMALAAGLCSAAVALAQDRPAERTDRTSVINAATEIMLKARYCALITSDRGGQPQARAVDPFPPEDGMVVWIATNAGTRKVAQIKRDPRVTLCYIDASGQGYVTLLGRAELVDSAAEKEIHWKKEWSSLYKDKNRGSDYLLIRVTPFRLEAVSYAHGVFNDPTTWMPASVSLP